MAGRWWSRMIAGLAALAVVLFAAAPLPAAAVPQPMAAACTEHQAPPPAKQPVGTPCCLGELCAMAASVLPPRPLGLFLRQPAIVALRPAMMIAPDEMPVPPLDRPPKATL